VSVSSALQPLLTKSRNHLRDYARHQIIEKTKSHKLSSMSPTQAHDIIVPAHKLLASVCFRPYAHFPFLTPKPAEAAQARRGKNRSLFPARSGLTYVSVFRSKILQNMTAGQKHLHYLLANPARKAMSSSTSFILVRLARIRRHTLSFLHIPHTSCVYPPHPSPCFVSSLDIVSSASKSI